MKKLKDKQAFPVPMGNNGMDHFEEHDYSVETEGMTYREWLVGMALQGIVSSMNHHDQINDIDQITDEASMSAIIFADNVIAKLDM